MTNWLNGQPLTLFGQLVAKCLYGENKGHEAALFSCLTDDPLALDSFELVEGTTMSYNGYCDVDRLLAVVTALMAALHRNNCVTTGGRCIAVAVKHGNPCGAATYYVANTAVRAMILGDPLAIHGGSVMLNVPVDEGLARELLYYNMPEGQRRLLDVICAPSFTDGAIELLRRKKDKCRLLANPALEAIYAQSGLDAEPIIRPVRGGFLVQEAPKYVLDITSDTPTVPWTLHCGQLRHDVVESLCLAWAVCWRSNSNTVTIVEGGRLIGNGCGRQDRVGAAELAISIARRGGHSDALRKAVFASDSFFPFPDGPATLFDAGVRIGFATSGSVNDKAVVALAKERGATFVTAPDDGARGFWRH